MDEEESALTMSEIFFTHCSTTVYLSMLVTTSSNHASIP